MGPACSFCKTVYPPTSAERCAVCGAPREDYQPPPPRFKCPTRPMWMNGTVVVPAKGSARLALLPVIHLVIESGFLELNREPFAHRRAKDFGDIFLRRVVQSHRMLIDTDHDAWKVGHPRTELVLNEAIAKVAINPISGITFEFNNASRWGREVSISVMALEVDLPHCPKPSSEWIALMQAATGRIG